MSKRSFDISFTGEKELFEKMRKLSDLSGVAKVVRQNTVELQEKTIRNAGTAFTKGYSTGATKRGVDLKIDNMDGLVGLSMEYNPYTELGTRFMAPAPILKPALEQQQIIFISDLKKLVGG